jgi:hypothetical protein
MVSIVVLLVVAAGPNRSPAHGGYPLSVSAASAEGLDPVVRLVLVYLQEGQGMNIEPVFFDGEGELEKAYDEGKADLLVAAPGADWVKAHCGDGGTPFEEKRAAYFNGRFSRCWSAPFADAPSSSSCGLSLVVHPRVVGDLRFSLLQKTLRKMLAAVDGDDLLALRQSGGPSPRSRMAAARALLRSKKLI